MIDVRCTNRDCSKLDLLKTQLFGRAGPNFKCTMGFSVLHQKYKLKGKCSTARIAIARKLVFQPNPKIRCLVFVILENKIFF